MRNLSDLEEIFSLQRIFQQALHKCNESGLCCFHLCISALAKTQNESFKGCFYEFLEISPVKCTHICAGSR